MAKSREPPLAADAIPEDCVLLSEAYEQVVDLLIDHPDRLPELDPDWAEALNNSREVEKQAGHAIIDVTGIQVMDTGTADHFLRMARAVRLLGAGCFQSSSGVFAPGPVANCFARSLASALMSP